jgi:hypothetical protein
MKHRILLSVAALVCALLVITSLAASATTTKTTEPTYQTLFSVPVGDAGISAVTRAPC